jgi:hypothetical protein
LAPGPGGHASEQFSLFLLHGENLVFDRALGHEPVGHDRFILPEAVGAIDGLALDGRVPPGIADDDIIGFREGESRARGAKTEKKRLRRRALAELLHQPGPLGRRRFPGDLEEGDLARLELALNDGEHLRELTEHQDRMSFLHDFNDQVEQFIKLG